MIIKIPGRDSYITCWHDVQHVVVDGIVNGMQRLHFPTCTWQPIQLWQWYSCNRFEEIEPMRGPIFRSYNS